MLNKIKELIVINNYDERFEENKRKIIENIEYGKTVGINKVSAIFAIHDEEKEKMEKELINWLILDGYKVSLIQDEMKILVIEWN